MKNITSFKNINIKNVLITLILIFNIHLSFSQVDLRTCGYSCTSNNYTLTDVFLSLSNVNGTPITNTTCTIGQVQQVYIYLNYSSNSSSSIHYARLNSDLQINGVTTFLNVLLGDIVPGSNKKLIYGPFNWTCGDELSLENTIIAWKTNKNNDPGPNYTCSSYTNSQCDYTNTFTISKPLAVQFTYKACTVGTNITVSFTSTTNGGKTPYTYAWDFKNDGGAPDSTLPNPTYTYTTSNNTAKLTVTDSQNLSNSYILPIIAPAELILSETHTTVSCGGGTSNITLGVTGGTPGYSYLWSNGAITKDLNNVAAGTYTVTVTDSNNCSKQLTVTIPSGDSIKPVIDPLPDPTTINCPEIPVFAQATATDNSGTVTSLTYTDQSTPGSCTGTYSITRTWTAKDACDNTSLPVSQTINVVDVTAPAWTTQSGSLNQTVECSNAEALAAAQALFPAAADLCDADVSNIEKVSGQFTASEGCSNAGTYTNTWTVKDDCGNTSDTFTQVITIEDTAAPVWSTQAGSLNQTVECSNAEALAAAQALFPAAADLCDADVSNIEKVSGQFTASEGCSNAGTYTNTWTVKDDCGNTSDTFTQVITIEDTAAPVWSTQAGSLNQTVECSNAEALAAAQALFPAAADLCDADVSNIEKVSGQFTASEGCSNAGTYTNTWTVKDDCGNTSDTFTQVITIEDTAAPVWSTQAGSLNQTVECSNAEALAAAQALFPAAADLCDADVSNIEKVSGQFTASEGCSNAGTYTNTWTVKDDCGNTSDTFTQVITIEDTAAPVWSTQAGALNQTVECSNAEALAAAQALFPAAADLCDADVSNIEKVSGQFTASEGCSNAGTYTNTWTVKDDCGNTSDTFTQIITIEDTAAPVWSTQAESLNQTVECSNAEALAAAQALFPAAADLCDADVSNIEKVSGQFTASEGCSNAGTYTNTWTVKDDCGNTSDTFTQIITIEDTAAPVWSTQAGALNQTVECSNAEALAAAQALFPAAADLCDADVSNIEKVSGQFTASEGCSNAGTYTNTWTVKDDCGNTSDTFTQVITIEDTAAPVWSTQAGSLNQTVECSNAEALAAAQALFPAAADLCDADVSNIEKVSGQFTASEGCSNAGTYTNTWTVKDDCGNTSDTFTQVITIEDTAAPVWSTQAGSLNQTVECSNAEALAAAQALFPAAADLCDADVSNIEKVSGQFTASEGCSNAGTYTNTWTVKDDCGNTSDTFTQVITIEDTAAPVWSTQAESLNQTVECSNAEALAAAQALFPAAADLCDADVSNIEKVSGQFTASEGCSNAGTYTNTWTVKDDCGNTSDTFTQVITIEDTAAPVWSTQAGSLNQTVECSNAEALAAAQALFPAAADLCDADVSNIEKVSGQFTASEGCSNAGTYTNTWTVKDDCGNTSDTFTQIITIEDTAAPVWSTQAGALNQTVECSNAEALAAAQALFPAAADLCDADVSNIEKVSGQFTASEGCSNAGTYTNTWTVKDDCGNTSDTFTQVITIEDTAAPVWSTQAGSLNQTVECSNAEALAAAQALFPAAADLCDADVSNIEKVSGQFTASEGCSNAGTYTNTWTVKDDCGNTSDTFTQVITIEDTAAPVWSTQAGSLNQTVECSNAEALAAAQALFPAAADLCDADVSNIEKVSGQFTASEGCSNAGTYTNTWTVKDDCGNTSDTFTQIITIEDTAAPVWSTQAGALNQTVECSNAEALAAAQALFPAAADLCDADVSNIEKVSGQFTASEGCSNAGTYTNTWTVKDDCGNTSDTFTQVITIEDTAAPVWSTQAGSLNQTVECSNAEALAAAQALFPAAADLCDADVSNIEKVSGQFTASEGCSNAGTYTNTWTVKDDCGNTSDTFTQVITIEDTAAPVWSTQAGALNQTVECSNAEALAAAQALFPAAADLCDADVSNIEKVSGQFTASEGCSNAGTYTNTWTVKDDCGNTSDTFTQVITIEDTAAPVWSTQAGSLNQTVECSNAEALAAAQALFPAAADLCDADVSNIEKVSGQFTASEGCSNAGTYTNTWTVKDDCGNTSDTFTQVITIEDTAAPVWSTQAGSLNQTVECSNAEALAAAQALFPAAADLCDADVSNIEKVSGQFTASEGCSNAGTYTNTWTVKDDCGNTSDTFTQIITIEDTAAPVWSTQAESLNQTVECSNAEALAAAQALFPAAADLCDADVSNIEKVSGQFTASEGCSNAGTYTNTWTVKDDCGNTSDTFTQVITIEDTAAPVWSTQAGSLNQTVECSNAEALAAAQALFPAAADLCDADVSNIEKVSGQFTASEGCSNAGTYTNTWTVKDDCGNTSDTFTQIITIEDTAAPVWSTQAGALNQTVECSNAEALAAAQALFPAAADLCDADVSNIEKVSGQFTASEGCSNAGTYTNTWTVKDDCGNTSDTFTQVITIEDTAAPVWSTQAGSLNQTVECSNAEALAAAQALFPAAADLCDADVSNIEKVSGQFTASEGCSNAGTYTNTWTVKDDCGNTSDTFTQVITIEDTAAPVWSTQAGALNITLQCTDTEGLNNAQTQVPIATDNCDGTVSYTKTSGQFTASEGCLNAGTYTNSWIAKDDCGNVTDSFIQVITIEDTTPPAFTGNLPTDITVSCDAVPEPANIEASDNCSGNLPIVFSETKSNILNECGTDYTLTRIWSTSDCSGNPISHTQIITVRDTTPPTGTAPADAADLQSIANIPAASPQDIIDAADNCSNTVTITISDSNNGASGCEGNAYILTRTYTLTDCSGNKTELVQTFTVENKVSVTGIATNVTCFGKSDGSILVTNSPGSTVVITNDKNEVVGNTNLPAGTYTLTATSAVNGENQTCTATATVVITQPDYTIKISGYVMNADSHSGIPNVMVTLIPQGTTTGPILLHLTGPDGGYSFTGMPAGSYLVQVQDANLNSVYQLYPVDSSLFFTTLEDCIFQEHTFNYGTSTLPVLGDYVWYDANSNGIQDEWYDANNDGVVTKNIPDAGGAVDYSLWEWIDLNGDGSYQGPLNVGELNAGGFGNALSPNIIVDGPNGYHKEVIIGIMGFWRDRPNSENPYGDYTIKLVKDANLDAMATALGVTGLVKVLPNLAAKTGKTQLHTVCSITSPSSYIVTVTPQDLVHLDADFGINCKEYQDIAANDDNAGPIAGVNHTTTNVLNVLVNDTLEGNAVTVSDVIITTVTPNEFLQLNTDGSVDVLPNAPVGTLTLVYQICEADQTSNCDTATVTITIEAPVVANDDVYANIGCNTFGLVGNVLSNDFKGQIPATLELVDFTLLAENENNATTDPNITIDNQGNVTVSSLTPAGTYTYTYRICDKLIAENCDTAVVTITVVPSEIVNITSEACNDDSSLVNLSSLLPEGTPITGTWIDTNNTNALQGNDLNPFGLVLGNYTFEYKIVDENCPRSILLNMEINNDCQVLACGNILVHNAFSPNGDGINDVFVIDSIDDLTCYPGNTVEIYNRWGILVFETSNYNNTTNAFDGTSRGRTTVKKSDGLPSGTYFYILNYKSLNGNNEIQNNEKDGYLYLSK